MVSDFQIKVKTKTKGFLWWSKKIQVYQVVKVIPECCAPDYYMPAEYDVVSEHEEIIDAIEARNNLRKNQVI